MKLHENRLYLEDVRYVAALPLEWEKLNGQTVLISGASGMIGRFLVDVLMEKISAGELDSAVCALGRDQKKLDSVFCMYRHTDRFRCLRCDVTQPLPPIPETTGYILHLASNTHPLAYAADPVGTIAANVTGTCHLLDLAVQKKACRFLFASSVEIYGENRGDTERFDEHYCGYLDCNTLRAGYPESKRCGEALCQAYIRQKNADAVIARLPRILGPTMQMSDSKASSQFIRKALAGENIVLKSRGTQRYSYLYVADAAAGLLYCLLSGECAEAYNVAGNQCDITLRELAELTARYAGSRVVFEDPDQLEQAGYSKSSTATLDGRKLQLLGWDARYSVEAAAMRTLDILQKTM